MSSGARVPPRAPTHSGLLTSGKELATLASVFHPENGNNDCFYLRDCPKDLCSELVDVHGHLRTALGAQETRERQF